MYNIETKFNKDRAVYNVRTQFNKDRSVYNIETQDIKHREVYKSNYTGQQRQSKGYNLKNQLHKTANNTWI